MKQKKTFFWGGIARIFFAFFLFSFFSSAFAEYSIAPAGGVARYFMVTAYYSPLPGQARYLRGNYAAEKVLNGKGTHGADGTPVYSGMLAAPYTYSFGTKIFLPGMGVGTVHDRGGAIVSAGNRGHVHDRIDVWMGYGDEGLTRALAWGKRIVLGSLYPANSAVAENFSFRGLWKQDIPKSYISKSAKKGLQNAAVLRLQKNLAALDYFSSPLTGYFGEETEDAVFAFQRDYNIVSSENDNGAGVFGPKTQKTLFAVLRQREEKKRKETEHFVAFYPAGISRGDTGEYVAHIQKFLAELGYFSAPFSQDFNKETEDAVFAFQRDYNIVSSENDNGAGVFGPKTQNTLLEVFFNRKQVLEKEKSDFFAIADFGGEKKEKEKHIVQKRLPLPEKIEPKVIATTFDEKVKKGVAVAATSLQQPAGMSMTFGKE